MDSQGNLKAEAEARAKTAPAAKEERVSPHQHEEKDRHEESNESHGEEHFHGQNGPDFLSFVVNLAGMVYMTLGLGEIPTEPNLPEAKYIIDSLDMLKEKTKGNLSPEEEKGMAGLLYELKVNFSKVASGQVRK